MPLHLDNLHAALTRTGKTPAAVSRELGVSRATVSRWFNGKGEPETLEGLKQLAAALDTTLANLVGEDAAMTPKEKLLLRAFRDMPDQQGDAALALLASMGRQDKP